ncbi:MAG TPA: PAS domain S-box protein [Dehalococcoidia bacterium]|nr:PAS domain S-box protein [Dehalococcoidia bacterium]
MKSDLKKKKAQLVEELERVRQQVCEFEAYKISYLASEKELRENEEKLRLMFESVNDGITVTDLNGTITDVNKAVLRLGRFDSENDVIGKSAFESIVSRDRERALADMTELFDKDTVGSGQYDLLRADGSEYPAEISAGLLKDAAGNPTGFISVIRDVSERKRLEQQMHFLGLVVEQINDSIIVTNTDYEIIYINQATKELFGYTLEEIKGKTPGIFNVEPLADNIQKSIYKTVASGDTYLGSILNRRKDGTIFTNEFKVSPLYDEGGQITAYIGIQRDVTQQRQAEESLRASEDKYKQLVELAPDAIISVDENGIVTSCNQAFVQQTGYDKQEIEGRYFTELPTMVSLDTTAKYNELFVSLAGGGELESFEFPWTHKDGSLRWGEVHATVVMIDGQFKGAQAVMRDVTERKQAEEIFRTISLGSPVGMYIVQDGQFVFANPQLLSDFGITEEMLRNVKPLSRVRTEDRETVRKNAVEMLRGIGTTPYEYAVINRRGETWWFMETVVPIQYRGKRAVLGNLLNITERRQTEERLRESRRRFRDLVNLLPQGIYEMDDKYIITFANRQAIDASGYTEEEVTASPLSALDTVIPEDRERMERNIRRIMNGERLGGIEYTQLRKDGRTYPIITYSAPIMRDGKATGLRGVTIDITEQKQAEEIFQTISMSSPASIYILQDGKFVFANHRFLERVGLNEEELLNTDQYNLIHPEDREMVRSSAIEMLKGIHTTPFEFRAFNKAGEMMWVAETVASIQYQGRRAVLASALNITERKQAEEALQESEERYRELAESITDVFFAFDRDLKYTYWNKASEELTGVLAQDALGKHLYDIFPRSAQTEQGEQAYLKALRTKRPQNFVNEYNINGRDIIFEISAYPSRDGLSVFVRDITEQKNAEEALQESEEKYRILVENSQDSIIMLDFDGTIQLANQASERLSGYSLDEGIGMNITEIVAPAYREEAMKKLMEAKSGEPVPYFETAVQRKDGTIVTIEACGQAVFKDGEAVGAQVIARDITERQACRGGTPEN